MSLDAHGALRAAFADAALSPDPDARPAGLDEGAARRFAVYRNNVHRALGEALAQAYPAVQRLVGEAFFAAMAREFLACSPPRAASLALWGEGFARFIEDFAPAASVPYLADVARLERAWLEALHAADAPVLEPAALSGLGGALSEARLAAHPAARLLSSPHPVVSIWQRNRAGGDPGDTDHVLDARAEHALVTRPQLEVRVQALDEAGAVFARALLDGHPASRAYHEACAVDPGFDVTGSFARLLAAGAFTTSQRTTR